MSSDAAPRSRRALLTAGLAAGVATVASALGRPLPVKAASGGFDSSDAGTAALSAVNSAASGSSALALYATTASTEGVAVYGVATSPSGSTRGALFGADSVDGIGVEGQGKDVGVKGVSLSAAGIGVEGKSGSGPGVSGESVSGYAVQGMSTSSTGVYGYSASASAVFAASFSTHKAAMLVQAYGVSTGVLGYSGVNVEPAAPTKTGIYGYSDSDDVTVAGTPVGVRGESPAGTGVLATTTTGVALQVAGKAKFSRCGRASVAKNKTFTDIMVAGGLAANSVVHATLQTYRVGVGVAAVRANYPSAGKARIYLTKVASLTAATPVGWFVAEY